MKALCALKGFHWIQVGGGLADLFDYGGDVLFRRAMRPNVIECSKRGIEITLRESAIAGVAGRESVSRSLATEVAFRAATSLRNNRQLSR